MRISDWSSDVGSSDLMMVFEPAFVKAESGDTVRFVAVDKGHNAESIAGMLPEGAEPFAGKFNQEITVTLEQPGVYGYRCKPHYGMGMVGMIVVGDAANVDTAKAAKHPGKIGRASCRGSVCQYG